MTTQPQDVADMTRDTERAEVPLPHLKYDWLRRDGEGVRGNGPPLHNVLAVTAWVSNERLIVYARGQMLRKDGTHSRVQRSIEVDYVHHGQPDWLDAIIIDARQRLGLAR